MTGVARIPALPGGAGRGPLRVVAACAKTILTLFTAFAMTGAADQSERSDPMMKMTTTMCEIRIELYPDKAPETVRKFDTRDLVYTIPLVLYGIFRYLYLMYQRPGERNPTEAILRDPPFLVNLLLWGLAVLWIVYGRELGMQ